MNSPRTLEQTIGLASVLILLVACSTPATVTPLPPTPTPIPPTPTPFPQEVSLGSYVDGGAGGFSHRWVAYIIEPPQDSQDRDIYVEVNGQRLGPYSGLGRRFEVSSNGEHIAYSALKDEEWWVVVDGQEKWTADGLGWAWYGWTADLDGRVMVPQTQSPIMRFSPEGDQLAYMVESGEGAWSIHVNGESGPVYENIYVNLGFVGTQLTYQAESTDGMLLMCGDRALGPYKSMTTVRYSSDGSHFAFGANEDGQTVLVVDGEERLLDGSVEDLAVGPAGQVAYALKRAGRIKVYANDQELQDDYDEVADLTFSPDGSRFAFWGRQGAYWLLVADRDHFTGYSGRYFYKIGDEVYSILWDQLSENLAYFAKTGEDLHLYLNGKETEMPDFPGIPLTVVVDDMGNLVGVVLMGGQVFDRQGFVECLLRRDRSKCDPLAATLARGELAYVETGDDGAYMVVGTTREGPYATIRSVLLNSADGDHYAYVVGTSEGERVVLDGKLMEWAYDSVYRPQFVRGRGFAHLGRRGNELYSVFYPYR